MVERRVVVDGRCRRLALPCEAGVTLRNVRRHELMIVGDDLLFHELKLLRVRAHLRRVFKVQLVGQNTPAVIGMRQSVVDVVQVHLVGQLAAPVDQAVLVLEDGLGHCLTLVTELILHKFLGFLVADAGIASTTGQLDLHGFVSDGRHTVKNVRHVILLNQ